LTIVAGADKKKKEVCVLQKSHLGPKPSKPRRVKKKKKKKKPYSLKEKLYSPPTGVELGGSRGFRRTTGRNYTHGKEMMLHLGWPVLEK